MVRWVGCVSVRRGQRGRGLGDYPRVMAQTWEYSTVPLMIHATKQILDMWGSDGWELVQIVTGPDGNGLVAYLKRPTGDGA